MRTEDGLFHVLGASPESRASREHLRTKLTPDMHSTKTGKSGVNIEMIKSDIFQDFSLKSYVVDIY